jgi:putative ATPase
MLEAGEDPLYIARRLLRMATEDVGLADNQALVLASSTYQAVQMVGMPECKVMLAHCVVYLSRAPKSVEVYKAYEKAADFVRNCPCPPVPLHLRNAPTELHKSIGCSKDYLYNPDYPEELCKSQIYLPESLQNINFFA